MNKKSKSQPRKSSKRPAARKLSRPSGNVTPVKELERLAKMSDNCRDRAKTATGQIGGEIKSAVDDKHLNAKAFRAVLAERRMGKDDPIKLRDFLDACEYYRDALKIEGMAASHMLKPKPPAKATDKKTGGGLRPLGGAAANVVTLAGAMQDAIAKDKTGDMEAA